MLINLNYGKQGLDLNLPDELDVTVIRKKNMPVLEDPVVCAQRALLEPVGCLALREEAAGCKTACIAICDITRPVPNSAFLRAIVEELVSGGVPLQGITILIATGLHRPNEGEELKQIVGDEWVLENVRVENHFAKNDSDHVCLGNTSCGTPVKIDRRFIEADLKIVTGLVEPHFMAGFSGGRKLITPGMASDETIRHIHKAVFLDHPKSDNCILEGNPVHIEQMEIMGKIGKVLAMNTVLDEERRLSYINFGEAEASHKDAVSFLMNYVECPVEKQYSTVVTTNAGDPLDRVYYQAVKGMVGAKELVAPGGNLFIACECSEGLGSEEFIDAQKRLIKLGPEKFMESILKTPSAEIDEWGTQCLIKAVVKCKVNMYADGLSDDEKALTGVHIVEDLQGAVLESIKQSGNNQVLVIPEGPYVVAVLEGKV